MTVCAVGWNKYYTLIISYTESVLNIKEIACDEACTRKFGTQVLWDITPYRLVTIYRSF